MGDAPIASGWTRGEFRLVISRSHSLASVVDGGSNPHLNLATRVGKVDCPGDSTCCFAGTFRADDGTRTHDLLHGKCERAFAPVRARSRPFAQTARLQGFPYKRANGTEPERTPNLAILATERLEAQRL